MARRRPRAALVAGVLALVCVLGRLVLDVDSRDAGRADAPTEESSDAPPAAAARLARATPVVPDPAEVERLPVAPEERATETPFVEPSAGTSTLAGVVHASTGAPAELVATLRARLVDPRPSGPAVQREIEVGVGRPWTLRSLPAGRWLLHATARGSGRHWSSEVVEARTRADHETRGLSLRLVEYGVEGVVRDGRGLPVAGAVVRVQWRRTVDPLGEADPHDTGTVTLGGAEITWFPMQADGELRLVAEGEVDLRWKAPVVQEPDVWSIDPTSLDLAPPPGEPPPSPAEFQSIVLGRVLTVGDGTTFHVDPRDPSDAAVTDAAGRFVLGLPGPGTFGLSVGGGEPVLLSEGGEVTVDALVPFAFLQLEAVRAARLVGTLRLAGGGSPTGMDCFLRRGDDSRNVEVDEDGAYAFDDLWPGRHLFYARGGGERGQDWCEHVELDLPEGQETRFDALLRPSFEVAGQALLADGAPAEGRTVVALGATNDHLSREARVGPDGGFTLRGLYPGEYLLRIEELVLEGEPRFFVDATHPVDFLRLAGHAPEPDDDSDLR